MSEQQRVTADTESEQLAALRAAIQIGIDDVEASRFDDVDDAHAWVREIADTVSGA